MSSGETSNWKDLIIERGAHPLPLAEDRYRAWVTGRQIFVSSLMDQEMTPYRNAVRAHSRVKLFYFDGVDHNHSKI